MTLQIDQIYLARELRDEIRELVENPKTRDLIDKIFPIRLARNKKGKIVRKRIPASSSKQIAGKDFYYLANGAFQGGGVLGLAHVGFVAGMEIAGVRFGAIAGTSAGAILATGMIAVRSKDLLAETHAKVMTIVADAPMADFIDGNYSNRLLIKRLLVNKSVLRPSLIPALLAMWRSIKTNRGLNPGAEFMSWLAEVFEENGMPNIKAMNETLAVVKSELEITTKASNRDKFQKEQIFKIIASSMPAGIRFEFPEHLSTLAPHYEGQTAAHMVRASMSIPLFFEPHVMELDKDKWGERISIALKNVVDETTLWQLQQLEEISFLDGGIFSNLPADAFESSMPNVPMIAVPLVNQQTPASFTRGASFDGLKRDAAALFDAVRLQRDREVLERFDRNVRTNNVGDKNGSKYRAYVVSIDTGNINWLNFIMDDGEKEDLLILGLRRARDFLKNGI